MWHRALLYLFSVLMCFRVSSAVRCSIGCSCNASLCSFLVCFCRTWYQVFEFQSYKCCWALLDRTKVVASTNSCWGPYTCLRVDAAWQCRPKSRNFTGDATQRQLTIFLIWQPSRQTCRATFSQRPTRRSSLLTCLLLATQTWCTLAQIPHSFRSRSQGWIFSRAHRSCLLCTRMCRWSHFLFMMSWMFWSSPLVWVIVSQAYTSSALFDCDESTVTDQMCWCCLQAHVLLRDFIKRSTSSLPWLHSKWEKFAYPGKNYCLAIRSWSVSCLFFGPDPLFSIFWGAKGFPSWWPKRLHGPNSVKVTRFCHHSMIIYLARLNTD